MFVGGGGWGEGEDDDDKGGDEDEDDGGRTGRGGRRTGTGGRGRRAGRRGKEEDVIATRDVRPAMLYVPIIFLDAARVTCAGDFTTSIYKQTHPTQTNPTNHPPEGIHI